MKQKILIGIATFMMLQLSQADLLVGTFGNMDFNDPLPSVGIGQPIDPATLSWQFGSPGIFDNSWLLAPVEQYVFLGGSNYSLQINAGQGVTNSYGEIFQTGDIPLTAKSVQLQFINGDVEPQLYINDIEIELFETSPGNLAGDIESWAGQTAELEIRVYAIEPLENDNYIYTSATIDDVYFSTDAIPEPSTIGLLGCASTLLLLYRNKKRSRTSGWTLR